MPDDCLYVWFHHIYSRKICIVRHWILRQKSSIHSSRLCLVFAARPAFGRICLLFRVLIRFCLYFYIHIYLRPFRASGCDGAARALDTHLHSHLQAALIALQPGQNFPHIRDRQLRCRGGSRSPEIRDKIRDRRVGFMSDRGDDRRPAVEHRLRDLPLIERPEILDGASAAADDDAVGPHPVQRPDSPDDAFLRTVSLHKRRI